MSALDIDDPVWVQDVRTQDAPRSYLVQMPTSCLRKNLQHIVPTPHEQHVHDERAMMTPAHSNMNNDERRPRSSSHERQRHWALQDRHA